MLLWVRKKKKKNSKTHVFFFFAVLEVSALTQEGLHDLFHAAVDVAIAPKHKSNNSKNKCSIL
jgi:hypothetical protein